MELHGFFLNPPDIEVFVDALYSSENLRRLSLSNNNIADSGVEKLCKLLEPRENGVLESLTIYNNNVSDAGAICLSNSMK